MIVKTNKRRDFTITLTYEEDPRPLCSALRAASVEPDYRSENGCEDAEAYLQVVTFSVDEQDVAEISEILAKLVVS